MAKLSPSHTKAPLAGGVHKAPLIGHRDASLLSVGKLGTEGEDTGADAVGGAGLEAGADAVGGAEIEAGSDAIGGAEVEAGADAVEGEGGGGAGSDGGGAGTGEGGAGVGEGIGIGAEASAGESLPQTTFLGRLRLLAAATLYSVPGSKLP